MSGPVPRKPTTSAVLVVGVLLLGYGWYGVSVSGEAPAAEEALLVPEERLQSAPESCGFAALAFYLSAQGIPTTEREISEHFGREEWMTFAEMVEYLELRGLEGRGIEVTPDFFVEDPMYSVVHLREEHFVVYVAALRGNHAVVFDPTSGYVRMSDDELARRMSGYVLYGER